MMSSKFPNVTKFLKSFKKIILDSLFPIKCLGCGQFDEWICDNCHTTLPIITTQYCPHCKRHETIDGQVCPECLAVAKHSFDGVFIASSYQDRLLKKAIHYYKYRFVYALSKPLSLLLAQSLQNSTIPSPNLILPVPLHKRRFRWRGFNQAELLARDLDLQIPINTDILKRVRYTSPQVNARSKIKRKENLTNAFIVTNKQKISGKNILLIDDIITTGTTLQECSKILKLAGANKVYCLVLARE